MVEVLVQARSKHLTYLLNDTGAKASKETHTLPSTATLSANY